MKSIQNHLQIFLIPAPMDRISVLQVIIISNFGCYIPQIPNIIIDLKKIKSKGIYLQQQQGLCLTFEEAL